MKVAIYDINALNEKYVQITTIYTFVCYVDLLCRHLVEFKFNNARYNKYRKTISKPHIIFEW